MTFTSLEGVPRGLRVAMDGPEGITCDLPAAGDDISIAVQDAEVSAVLSMIHAAGGLPAVTTARPDLGDPVTMEGKDVGASELLRRVLFAQGLGCVVHDGRVIVTCERVAE